jgi:GT2 family glycosyltransferase
VLGSDYANFDVVVVDQSNTDATAEAVRLVANGDPRVTYIHSAAIGKSAANNLIIERAPGPLIALTDDDCEVAPTWLPALVAHFQAHPDVGQVCGVVNKGPHDATQGYIPDAPIRRARRIKGAWSKWRDLGIGANVAFRLSAVRAVGSFDTVLGPGSPLHAGEDLDMTYRVLKAGYTVLNVADASVIHHGFRTWAEGEGHMRHTGKAMGALYMKHLRLGDAAVIPTILYEGARCISWTRLVMLRPRTGLRRFGSYGLGLVVSFRYSIDRQRRVYYPGRIHHQQPAIRSPRW